MTEPDASIEDERTLTSAAPSAPEDRVVFRLAQLALLLSSAAALKVRVATLDRLAYYEFFSASPYVVVQGTDRKDDADRLRLRLAGFSDRQLSYASTGQRFISRRRRLQHDLALLISYGVVTVEGGSYTLTERGIELCGEFNSLYADAYREASVVVLTRLSRLNDKRLRENVERWLGRPWVLLDLFDDVEEAIPGTVRGGGQGSLNGGRAHG